MKIIVAAAGKGTRMKELGFNKPKHLLEVGGHPFLYYLLENIKKAGFKDIVVVGGYKIEKLQKFLNSYDKKIELVDQWKKVDKNKYGTILPVEAVADMVKAENFVFISGDNYYTPADIKKFNKDDKNTYVASRKSENPELYGAIKKDKKGNLAEIIEKPMRFISNQISVGLYKFTPEIFKKINKVEKSEREEFELVDAVNLLAKEKPVKVTECRGHWFDFGKPEDIGVLEKFLKNEKVIK